MSASIVEFPARDPQTRFACRRHAADARRAQAEANDRARRRGELLDLAGEVADELSRLSPRERIARLEALDRRLVASLRRSHVFPERPEPPGPECA